MNAASARLRIIFGLAFQIPNLLFSSPVHAQVTTASVPRTEFRAPDELLGIITNQTMTPLGQEFYNRFNDFWREHPDFENYSFVISERHSKRYGSQISIVYRQRPVFSGSLPYRYGQVRAFSADAAAKVHSNIIGLSLRAAGDKDPDIADDEF
jgi:curli production assembly/transport component CsgE